MIRVDGRVSAETSDFHTSSLNKIIEPFGSDIIGLWIPSAGVTIPLSTKPGDPVTDIEVLIGQRGDFGEFRHGFGHGAPLVRHQGVDALDATNHCPEVISTAADRLSFGLGVLLYVSDEFLSQTAYWLGNSESSAGRQPHTLYLPASGRSSQLLLWDGMTTTWSDSATTKQLNDIRVTEPGWYSVAVDVHGGNCAIAVNQRDPVVAAEAITTPTMSSTFFGGREATGAGTGFVAVAAMMSCDGPLAQDAARLAGWRAICSSILS